MIINSQKERIWKNIVMVYFSIGSLIEA